MRARSARRSARGGLLRSRRGRVVAMLSGGRDSICLLDVAVALLGARRACARCTSTTGCATQADGDERHCAALCERLGVRAGGRAPERAGRRRGATCRRGRGSVRYGAGPRGSRRERDALIARRAHRHRPGRDDPLPAGRLAGPARAAGDARARGAAGPPAAGRSRASRPPPTARARGLPWREDESNDDERLRARARAPRAACRRCARSTRPPRRTCCAPRGCCARRPRCWTRSSTPSSAGGDAIAHRRGWTSCRRRSRGWSSCASPSRPPARYVPQAGERVEELLALGAPRRPGRAARRRARGRRDRGRACCGWSSCRARRASPSADRRERLDSPPWPVAARVARASRRSARCSSAPRTCSAACASSASRSRATTPGQRAAAGRRAEGRRVLPRRPDARHRHPRRGRLHGGRLLRLGDRLLRGRADPQGPRRGDRGPRRADRRGHRRLRPDAAVPAAQPRLAQPAHRSRCARC